MTESSGGIRADDFVERYLAEMGGGDVDLDRLVTEPSGLDTAGMLAAIADPRFREPGRQPIALQMMCDLMAPEGSMYFDAIYGDFHGQHAIRNWLVPVMATIDFIEFVPTAPEEFFDDGEGGTSLDEWQMFARFGDDRIPLSRGVSVRRYRDGWITWACDVYDTGPFRVPPPDDAPPPELPPGTPEPEPLPDWPRTDWQRHPAADDVRGADLDADAMAERFHPTGSVLHDPVAGELRGREAIHGWLVERAAGLADSVFEPVGPLLDDGSVSVQEWQQFGPGPDGERTFMTRGTSVRRRDADGLVTYAADYYDTASLP